MTTDNPAATQIAALEQEIFELNQKLLALTFDPSTNLLRGIASADLAADAARVARRR